MRAHHPSAACSHTRTPLFQGNLLVSRTALPLVVEESGTCPLVVLALVVQMVFGKNLLQQEVGEAKDS